MSIIGVLFGVLSLLGALIAFIPLLGWLNWIVIPFSIIGLIMASITRSSTGKRLCTLAIVVGMFRLMLGGGIL